MNISLVFLVSGTGTKLCTRLRLHQFCLTLLSERGDSYKTDANKIWYEALYKAPLTRKTRLYKTRIHTKLMQTKFGTMIGNTGVTVKSFEICLPTVIKK